MNPVFQRQIIHNLQTTQINHDPKALTWPHMLKLISGTITMHDEEN